MSRIIVLVLVVAAAVVVGSNPDCWWLAVAVAVVVVVATSTAVGKTVRRAVDHQPQHPHQSSLPLLLLSLHQGAGE